MEKIHYKTIQETLYHKKMDNGLEVYLLPKLGFEKTYGLFSTKFGSVDTTFIPLNEKEMIKVEDGIAHFLEHKMFDMKGTDASDAFANLGASTNAFTSSSRTAYQFTTTSNENECIELLLDFVQSLDLTKESVEKEKGIIKQEIKMYDDDPDWRVYFGSIANLYQQHPVAVDIAGTVETVNATTKEMLELCYHTFYHPSNMMLFVVGNIDPEKTMELIEQNQAKKHFDEAQKIERLKVSEPLNIDVKKDVLEMDVDMSKIIASIKVNEQITNPIERIKRELSLNLFFDLVFSKSSSIYNEWLEKGIINSSFSANFTQERDYAFIQMGGDVDDVVVLENKMLEFIENIHQITIDEEDFMRIKRKNIGMFINLFNSPESIANLYSRYYFEGISAFEIIDIVATITVADIVKILPLFNLEYTSICIVKNSQK